MGRRPDVAKQDEWRRRFWEFERGDEGVVDFCDREGVSVTAFYRWRRRLLAATGRTDSVARRSPGPAAAVSFVPVAITRPLRRSATPTGVVGTVGDEQSAAAVSRARVEAVLPGGVRLLVPCDEPAAIRAVIAALVEGRREEPAC